MSSSDVKHSMIWWLPISVGRIEDGGSTLKNWRSLPLSKLCRGMMKKLMKCSVHDFLFECGKRMEMKTLVMAAAATICQRYYAQRPFTDIPIHNVGSAALLLASKAEEFPASMEDVLMATYDVWNNTDKYPEKRRKYYKSQKYEADASKMASAERALMCSVNFEFNIEHSYPYVYEVVETCGKNGWLKAKEQFAAVKGAIPLLNQSLRGTMCLEYPPSYRARLAVYVALLGNGIPAPSDTEENWAFAMEFGEEQLLKKACCQLLECLDEEEGQTGIKLTRTMVYEALVITGMVRNFDSNSKPRAPRSFDERKEAGRRRASSSGKTLGKRQSSDDAVTEWPCPPPSSSSGAASAMPPPPNSKPRPPAPKPPVGSKPRPPSAPKPPSNSKPRPPSAPKPRPPSAPKPPSASKPRPPSDPKLRPPSNPKPPPPSAPKPRPPSAPKPRPPSAPKPRPPSAPKPRPPSAPKPPPPSAPKPRPPSAPKSPSGESNVSPVSKSCRHSPGDDSADTAGRNKHRDGNASPVGKRCHHSPGADSADTAGRKKHRSSGTTPFAAAAESTVGDEMEDGEVKI